MLFLHEILELSGSWCQANYNRMNQTVTQAGLIALSQCTCHWHFKSPCHSNSFLQCLSILCSSLSLAPSPKQEMGGSFMAVWTFTRNLSLETTGLKSMPPRPLNLDGWVLVLALSKACWSFPGWFEPDCIWWQGLLRIWMLAQYWWS